MGLSSIEVPSFVLLVRVWEWLRLIRKLGLRGKSWVRSSNLPASIPGKPLVLKEQPRLRVPV